MNKLIFIFFLTVAVAGKAQPIQLSAWTTSFVTVQSNAGATVNNMQEIFIQLNNSQGYQMQNWSLTYRVQGNITNGSKNFPAGRLKFRFNSLSYNGIGNGPPTAANMALLTSPLAFSTANSFFVQQSPYSFQINNGYFSVNLRYDVLVDGGAYLDEYKSWDNYNINLVMELRNRRNELMGTATSSFGMQVRPDLNPTPTYGLQFNAPAKNVLLEFANIADYQNGVSKTYSNAFSTFSNTPYTVNVQALSSNLTSDTNQVLPISSVRLQVKENATQILTGNVNLTSAPQNIITSTAHTVPRSYDTTYQTQSADPTFFNKPYLQYNGTLIYTIVPQ